MNRHSIVLLVILVLIGTGMFSLIKIQQGRTFIATTSAPGQGGLVIGGSAAVGGQGSGGLVIKAAQPGTAANIPATAPAGPIDLPADADAAACP
ncbi:MAG: hypothetical protein RBT68_05950 [Spirochaetia bacterium]|jgi:hypothetical protein|nr:hypothetical protein [Spirochaetia bacterium]